MKKLFSIIMSVLMIACFMPSMAFATESYSSEYTVIDLSQRSGTLSPSGTKVVLTGTSTAGVTVELGDRNLSELILDGAAGIKSIKMEYLSSLYDYDKEDQGISIKLKGENKISELVEINGAIIISGDENASLTVGSATSSNETGLGAIRVVIKSGSVTAYGNGGRPGIGWWSNLVTIKGGTVNATSSGGAAAIGGGSGSQIYNSPDGFVTITGGEVAAEAKGTGAAIGNGDGYSVTGNVVWITGGKVTAKSNSGSAIGSGKNAKGDGLVQIEGGTINAESNSGALIGTRKTDDWGATNIYGGTYNFDPSKYLPAGYKAENDEDGTYTVKIKTYNVTFDTNNGSENTTQIIEHGKNVTKPTDPTETGYTFAGWYTDKACTEAWDFEEDPVTAETTLYAKWTINKYTVTFNNTGDSVVPAQNVEHGTTINMPTDPTREGYEFKGWFNGEKEWTSEGEVTGNVVLTAKWDKIATDDKKVETKTETTSTTDAEGKTTTTTTETVKEDGKADVVTETKTETTVTSVENGTMTTTQETVKVDGKADESKTKTTVVTTTTEKKTEGEVTTTVDTVTTKVTSGNTTTEIKTEETKNAAGQVTKTVSTETETVKTADTYVTTSETTATTTEGNTTTVKTVKNTTDTVNKVKAEAEVKTVTKENGKEINTTKVTANITKGEGETLPKTISIDATKAQKETKEVAAAEVTLPNTTVETLKAAAESENEGEQVKTVAVTTDVAKLTIDNTALQTLTKDAGSEGDGKSLVLKVEKTDSTVGQTGNAQATFELSAVLKSKDNTETKVFDNTTKQNGTIAVSVNYEKKYSRSYLTVYYVDGEGDRTAMPTNYSEDILTWTTTHFSEFEVVETVRSSGGYVAPTTDDTKKEDTATDTKTDEQIQAENAAKAASLTKALTLKARSVKTAKGNIKVTLTVDNDAIKAIEDLGYTVKYKFYRSTKKAASYKAAIEKTGKTYTNTSGKKGTKYYYKARVMVYDAQGALVTKSALTQCKYACRKF